MRNRLAILSLLIILPITGQAQPKVNDSTCLIMKIIYKYNKRMYERPAFILMPLNNVNKLACDTNLNNNPPIIANYLTKYGGFYISEIFVSAHTMACYQYNNIEKGISKYIKTPINPGNQGFTNENLLEKLIYKKSLKIIINNQNESYIIRFWFVKLDYQICNLYMETPAQPIFRYESAYIKNILTVSKPSKYTYNLINNVLKQIVKSTHKLQS